MREKNARKRKRKECNVVIKSRQFYDISVAYSNGETEREKQWANEGRKNAGRKRGKMKRQRWDNVKMTKRVLVSEREC